LLAHSGFNFIDNGEFACGDILKACLNKVEGFNVLVCVSRHVDGMFVTDMVQAQKHRAVKEAASKALELLKEHLTNAKPVASLPTIQPRDSFYFDSRGLDLKVAAAVPKLGQLAPLSGQGEDWAVDF